MEILTSEELADLFDRLNFRNDYSATIIIDGLNVYNDFINELRSAKDVGIENYMDYFNQKPFSFDKHFKFIFHSGSTLNVVTAGWDKSHLLEVCKESAEIITDNDKTFKYIEELLGEELNRNEALDEFLSEFKII